MLFTRDVSLFGGTCHFEYPSGNGTGWKLWHAAILEEHVNNLIITLHQFLGWFEHNMTCQLWRVTWKYILCYVWEIELGKTAITFKRPFFVIWLAKCMVHGWISHKSEEGVKSNEIFIILFASHSIYLLHFHCPPTQYLWSQR